MDFMERFLDPKTSTILRIAFGKILQRFPLTLCMILSIAVLTYVFTFYERVAEGGTLGLFLLLTFMLAITTSFALEYDTKDELMLLINLGISPSDIFNLGIFRVLAISLIGYVVGVALVIILPLSSIKNVMLFYAFLIAAVFGIIPPLYSSLKSMRVSLLGRVAFRPIIGREVPIILALSEVQGIKEFVEERLSDRQDLIIVETSQKPGELIFICRYLGDFGRETFAMLATLSVKPDKALRNDETLPIVVVKVSMKEGKNPVLDCWEGNDEKHKKRSSIALSFQALVQQFLIEYKVYSGRLRGAEFRS